MDLRDRQPRCVHDGVQIDVSDVGGVLVEPGAVRVDELAVEDAAGVAVVGFQK